MSKEKYEVPADVQIAQERFSKLPVYMKFLLFAGFTLVPVVIILGGIVAAGVSAVLFPELSPYIAVGALAATYVLYSLAMTYFQKKIGIDPNAPLHYDDM